MATNTQALAFLLTDESVDKLYDYFVDELDQDVDTYSKEKWVKELLTTLTFSYSSVLADYLLDNKAYFKAFKHGGESFDDYTDRVIMDEGDCEPFNEGEPAAFFKVLNDCADLLIKKVAQETV